jgi:sterol 14-demethylase
MEKEARSFVAKWGDSGEIEFLDAMNRLTILTARWEDLIYPIADQGSSRCLLGPEIRDDPKVSSDFARLYHDLEGGLNALAFFFPHLPIPAHRRRDQARIDIQSLFSKVIKQRRQLKDDDVHPDDMLQILMECEYKTGEKLDDYAITGMLVGILFAGQHTSGITATWTCYFLQKNPAYLKELQEEQEELKAEFGSSISFDSLKKSVKLENAVRVSYSIGYSLMEQ